MNLLAAGWENWFPASLLHVLVLTSGWETAAWIPVCWSERRIGQSFLLWWTNSSTSLNCFLQAPQIWISSTAITEINRNKRISRLLSLKNIASWVKKKQQITSWIFECAFGADPDQLALQFAKKKKKKSFQDTYHHFIILFVLRFYGPVNPMGSCQARSVYLTTRFLGKLSPLGG